MTVYLLFFFCHIFEVILNFSCDYFHLKNFLLFYSIFMLGS